MGEEEWGQYSLEEKVLIEDEKRVLLIVSLINFNFKFLRAHISIDPVFVGNEDKWKFIKNLQGKFHIDNHPTPLRKSVILSPFLNKVLISEICFN